MNLLECQSKALNHFRSIASLKSDDSRSTLCQIVKMANLKLDVLESAIANIQNNAKICLHFHPDRLDLNQETVAENLLKSGRYKSQFESKISNGSVSASPGGDRDLWERKLFNGAYSFDSCDAKDRPKYGSLQLLKHADGSSPNFGSCYFVLKPTLTKRATFTYLDSHRLPEVRGTIDSFDYILSEVLTESFYRDFALGEHPVRPKDLLSRWADPNYFNSFDPSIDPIMRNSAHYVEAQVHGDIHLNEDVSYLVLDPCFHKTKIGDVLINLSKKYNFPIKFHKGFKLNLEDVPLDYRGSTMKNLAVAITNGSTITPKDIGKAAQKLKRDPDYLDFLGDKPFVLQELKLLWHVLLRFG
jgi:hypothetical protein